MAGLEFVKTFILCFIVILAVCAGLLKLVPFTRNHGWRTTLACIGIAAAIGYLQGLAAVRGYAQSAVQALHQNPGSETSMRYLVGDSLPTLRRIGGSPTPEMMLEARRIAEKGPPCPAAMAANFLGGSINVDSACRAE